MFDPTRPIDDESVEGIDQGEDRPPQRSPGGVVSFPVPLAATRRDGKAVGVLPITSLAPVSPLPIDAEAIRRRERSRSFLAHPSNRARSRAVRSWREEQASVPEAGHRAQSGGTAAMPDWLEREVMNEVDTRRKNEWIEETNDSYAEGAASDEYACECSDADCTSTVSLTRIEYEAVRADGTHFAIAINHENPFVDRVVSETERFAVVAKCFRAGRRIAGEHNPRR